MNKIRYTTHGTCSREIEIELDGDTVKSVKFIGGCSGNTQGVAEQSPRHVPTSSPAHSRKRASLPKINDRHGAVRCNAPPCADNISR